MIGGRTARERIVIEAPAAVVYAALSDVRRMGEWSPECVGATPDRSDAEPAAGFRFTGHNRTGTGRSWSTRCRVTAAEPGRCFAFDVYLGGRVSSWRFDLAEAPDGTRTDVVQSWWDRRGAVRRRLAGLASGVRDRAGHNRHTMRVTLRRLKAALESG